MKGVHELYRVTRTLIKNNIPCLALFVFTCLAIVLGGLITNYGSQNLPSMFSPSPSPSSSGDPTFGRSTPPPSSSIESIYPKFKSPKIQRAVENLVLLNEETLSRRSGKERDEKMGRIEAGLARARALIREAIIRSRNSTEPVEDADYVPRGPIYRNAYVFQRSYSLMEKVFKIYVYEEGEPPLFHNGPSKDIYSTEGILLGLIESNTQFRTLDPDQAHVYFLPFSVVMILQHLFDPIIRDKAVLGRVVSDYVRVISSKYSYWNRSLGSDHFMLSCHDWGPRATWYVHQLYFTSIRVLCNANTSEFFNPKKDVSFPEINLRTGNLTSLTLESGQSSSNRTILAFFAGHLHGRIRRVLFQYWLDKDKDIKVFEKVPENSSLSYREMMEKSKFCLCPSGHEVASPRIVEAIYAECVPVLISQDYVLPFSDVLDWDEFSVRVSVEEMPKLKKILMGISEDKYLSLHKRVKEVQRHLTVNVPPKKYDVFHMMIHSLWLRRLNIRINA